jgi:micrococcal nuclease
VFRRPPSVLAALVLVAALYLLARGGDIGSRALNPRGVARVVHVVDGDTIDVRLGGRRDTVRYIGIDTPEEYKPDTPVECFSRIAARVDAELVAGERVRLVTDREERDRYGRLLAYVYRARDGLFVNAELMRRGLAHTLPIRPNVRYAARFAKLQKEARRAGRGLWDACPGLAERYG